MAMVCTGGRRAAGRRYRRSRRVDPQHRSVARPRGRTELNTDSGGRSVRADPAVQRRLLDLAEVDTDLTRIDHRRRTLPELTEIVEREAEERAKRDKLVAVRTTLSDLDRDASKQESEIEAVRAREDRDRALLKNGNVGARQLADLEHELGTLS